jgi:hypothetical protein
MMGTKDPSKFGFAKIRPYTVHNFTGFFIDNPKNIRIPGAPNDIIRMKPFVPHIIPFVFSQGRNTVDGKPEPMSAMG